jgi:hypothetical protein
MWVPKYATAALIFGIAISVAGQTYEGRQTSSVEVSLRLVRIFVTSTQGEPACASLRSEDVEVLEDRRPADPMTVAVTSDDRQSAVGRPTSNAPVEVPGPLSDLRQVVYVERQFLSKSSAVSAAKMLDAAAESLVARGPVELVFADPDPRVLMAATRNPDELRKSLQSVIARTGGYDDLVEIRLDTIRSRGATRLARARMAVIQEQRLVEAALERLARWALGVDGARGGALYLLSDGFDVTPREFYGALLPFGDSTRLDDEGSIRRTVESVRAVLASRMWVVFPIASAATNRGYVGAGGGARVPVDISAGQPSLSSDSLFVRPLEAMLGYADATGGLVIGGASRLVEADRRLSSRCLLSYQGIAPNDGQAHELEVRSKRPDLRVSAPHVVLAGTSVMTSEWNAKQLLRDADERRISDLEVMVRLEARPGSKRHHTAIVYADVGVVGLRELLMRVGRGTIRVTVAVERPRGEPFVRHDEHTVGPDDLVRGWRYEAPINWDGPGGRVAVLVEELRSGLSGGGIAVLPESGQ